MEAAVRLGFASDNWAGAHPAVIAALGEAGGEAPAYGDDEWTTRAEAWFATLFGPDAGVALVWGGTAANVIGLQLLAPGPRTGVICTPEAHIANHEGGAPARIAGVTLLTAASVDGKLDADAVRAAIPTREPHLAQPAVVSLSQPTEVGTLYTPAEARSVANAAHEAGLLVHMDGARIANAAAALQLDVAAFTRDAGVDALSFGGTKNGLIGAEAVVVFDPRLAEDLPLVRMRSLQLASKARYLAAQFLALAEDDLWLRNASHANAMARRLVGHVADIDGVEVAYPADTNAVFARIPAPAAERLRQVADFHGWDDTGVVRWMTSWATTAEEVDAFAAAVRRCLSP